MKLSVVRLKRFFHMRTVAMLASLLIVLSIVKMTVANSALNVMRALGRMKRLWQNVRPIVYYYL
jgi:hypothetical protein